MKLMESLKRFWNETLGPDYTEQEDTEINNNPELKAGSERVKALEEAFKAKQVSNNKGNKVVETVVIDPKAVAKMAEAAKTKKQATVSKEDKQLGE